MRGVKGMRTRRIRKAVIWRSSNKLSRYFGKWYVTINWTTGRGTNHGPFESHSTAAYWLSQESERQSFEPATV